jgi:hypothetical protein
MAFECKYCLKNFVRETSFMKHECSQMKRAKDTGSKEGLGAYAMYSEWMKQKNHKVPPIETFSTSRYFNSFINFVHHAKKLNLPSTDLFIKLMVMKDLSPMLWCRDECYSLYLEWIDRKQDPIDQAAITVETLYKIAEAIEKPVVDVFKTLNANEVMHLIRQRQLSPWLLLCSTAFKSFLLALSGPERDELLNLIGYNYWAEKFAANPSVVENMKLIASELGI